MTQSNSDTPLSPEFDRWLTEEIRKLSVDTLSADTVTCNACGEVAGEYVVDYRGETFRFQAEKAYAFLQFIAAQSQ